MVFVFGSGTFPFASTVSAVMVFGGCARNSKQTQKYIEYESVEERQKRGRVNLDLCLVSSGLRLRLRSSISTSRWDLLDLSLLRDSDDGMISKVEFLKVLKR